MAAAAAIVGGEEVGAASAALAAFEVAVGGGGATFAGLQDVGVHAEAHGAAGLAPLKARGAEDLVETLFFAWCLTRCEPGTTMARILGATWWPLMMAAAARRSSMRPLVQEPRKTVSI